MASKPILGYWDIRGLAEHIRTLLTYLNIDFEDKRYTLDANYEKSEWFVNKYKMSFDFPNLPYYIDGDVRLTQSVAICRYLARKHKLDGQNEQERIRISLIEQQIMDLFMALGRICYDENCDKLKVDYLKNLPGQIELLSKFLKDHPFVAGENISYVDFLLHEFLVKISKLVPGSLDQSPNLKKFIDRIESLPRVSAWLKKREPKLFNGPMSHWNATL